MSWWLVILVLLPTHPSPGIPGNTLHCLDHTNRWDSALSTAISQTHPPSGGDDGDIARAPSAHMSRPRGRTDKPPPIIRKQKDGVASVPPSGSACCDCRGRYPLHSHRLVIHASVYLPSRSYHSSLHSCTCLTQSPIFYPSTNRSDMDAIKKLRGPHSCRLPAGA